MGLPDGIQAPSYPAIKDKIPYFLRSLQNRRVNRKAGMPHQDKLQTPISQ